MKLTALAALLLTSGITLAQDTTSSSSVSSTSSSTLSSSTSTASTSSTAVASTSSSTTASGSAPTVGIALPPGNTVCTEEEAQQIFTADNYTGNVALCGFSGNNNTIVIPPGGFTTYITWWTGAFNDSGATVTTHLDWTDALSHRVQWTNDTAAHMGFVPITIDDSFLNGATTSNFRLILDERGPSSQVQTVGPIIYFSQQSTTPQPPAPTKFNFLGVAIGVPIGVFVIALVLGVMCCMTRRDKGIFSRIKLPTRRKGYGVRQSRRQRMGNPVDEFDFDASAPIYRDDPGANYENSTREERSARAMGVFSSERNLHSTY